MTADGEVKKRRAAEAALELVAGETIIGVGTGSTVNLFIDALARLPRRPRRAVSSSQASTIRLAAAGIEVRDLNEVSDLHLYIDGADETTAARQLVKGGGGALTREKIIAAAARRFVCIVDDGKLVQTLGRFPLPVEVIKFAQALVAKRMSALGAQVQLRTGADGKPFLTDENNHILDCRFGEIADVDGLARKLSDMPGVVEHGLFIGMASVVIFARGNEIVELRRGT